MPCCDFGFNDSCGSPGLRIKNHMFNWWRTTQCWRGSVLNSSVPSLPPQAVHTALGLHRLAHCLRYCGLNQPCDWDSFTWYVIAKSIEILVWDSYVRNWDSYVTKFPGYDGIVAFHKTCDPATNDINLSKAPDFSHLLNLLNLSAHEISCSRNLVVGDMLLDPVHG